MTDHTHGIRYTAIPTADARFYQAGHADANGQKPEFQHSDGGGNPCRHCLQDIAQGDGMLVLAYRPFSSPQPYAEIGPIFLHADECERHADEHQMPTMFLKRDQMMVRGYGQNDRIKDGSGAVVPSNTVTEACQTLLEDPEISYVHVRSASNNCYQARVERG